MAEDARADASSLATAALFDLGRIEAVVGEMVRAGKAPVIAVGMVPVPELSRVRLGVFAEAGGVAPPGTEAWLSPADAASLVARHQAARAATWDAGVDPWSAAWTNGEGPLVLWTPSGARLRVGDGVVDVLEEGRWTVVPVGRVARVSLSSVSSIDDQEGVGLVRLHTVDGRSVGLKAGRIAAAAMAAEGVAAALGVPWGTSRWGG